MNIKKKKILIKVTSSIGTSMISNAEYHTLFYFCKWLSKDCDIVVSGIEKNSQIIEDLKKFNVKIKKPFLKYLFLKKFKYFFHIPISIINTFIDATFVRPNLLVCLGGVFYNGLGIVITGKLLGFKTLVRSAEDHDGLAQFDSVLSFIGLYARFRALISKFVIKNSDYFLTVGEWSITYFREKYNLSSLSSFMIPGPVDNSICIQKSFHKTALESKKKLTENYKLGSKYKTILFIGSRPYKGTKNVFDLLIKLKKLNIKIKVLWISTSDEIKIKRSALNLNSYVKIIKPVNRDDLVALLKGVDFLFWSTHLGVGYGQIMLESILCGTEIICFKPIGDAKYLVKDNFYAHLDEVIDRIKGKKAAKKINIPKFMNEKKLCNQHLDIFKKILES